MKVTHNKIGQNLNIVDGKKTGKADESALAALGGQNSSSSEAASSASKINLSNRAQEMKKAKEVALSAPDIDEEKVARFQKLIDNGEYKVSSSDIADKMIEEELKNS